MIRPSTGQIIPEYSCVLRIEVEIVRIRLKCCERKDFDFWASFDFDSTGAEIGLVQTDLNPYHDTDFGSSLKAWDTAITPRQDDSDIASFGLLLKWNGATAYRIGLVYFSSTQIVQKAQLRAIDLG